jgi:ribonuclease P/MRP protein subunit POP5
VALLTASIVVYFSSATSTAILRVQREHYRLLWAALTLLTSIPLGKGKNDGKVDCVIRVVRVSGTVRKAEEEAIRRAREMMRRAREAGIEGSDLGLGKEFDGEDVQMMDRNESEDESDSGTEEDDNDEEDMSLLV